MSDSQLRPVYSALSRAEDALPRAEAASRELEVLTAVLPPAPTTQHHRGQVCLQYRSWLASVGDLLAGVREAIDLAGRPPAVVSWWQDLLSDPIHLFFAGEASLGERAGLISESAVIAPNSQRYFYWTFSRQPMMGDPIVPHCQVYEDRLYYEILAPAREHLFEWTLRERLAHPEPFSWTG